MRLTLEERFWPKVDVRGPDECWEWQGALTRPGGYGKLARGGRNGGIDTTHRMSYRMFVGPIPDGMWVLHTCDNPPCVNPAHLFLGTHEDNMADQRRKGRSPRGEKNVCAKLTEEQVVEVRRRYAAGGISMRALGEEFGITASIVHHIVHRVSWSHVA